MKSLALRVDGRERILRWKWIRLETTICTRERAEYGHKNKSTDPHLELQAGQRFCALRLGGVAAHLGGQVGRGAHHVAAAVAVADGLGVLGVVVDGVPVVLGGVAGAAGLLGADGHVVGVAIGVHDGGHVVAAAGGDEVGLTPGGREGARRGEGVGGLGPADLGVVLEGDDLAGTGGQGEGQGGGLGGDGGAQVGLDAVGAVEGLVPDDHGQGLGRGVDEGVGEVVAIGGGDLDHVGALGAANVADGADLAAGAAGGRAEAGEVVGQADEAVEQRGDVVADGRDDVVGGRGRGCRRRGG
jgi:hypothetical protein